MKPGPVIASVDRSDEAADALALAGQLADLLGTTLLLASVYPDWGRTAPVPDYEFDAEARREAQETLLDAAGRSTAAAVETRALSDRSVARALDGLAREVGASTVVAGSTRRGRVGSVLPGTTADRLLHGAPCAVALAPRGFAANATTLRRIGCAYDAGEEARVALRAAERLASAAGARLEVISCVEPVSYGAPTGFGYANVIEAERERCRKLTADAAAAVGIAAEPVVVEGFAGRAIGERSAALDLLVCGSRGYGPLRAALVGSVSGHLFHHAACAVLAVPRRSHDPFATAAEDGELVAQD